MLAPNLRTFDQVYAPDVLKHEAVGSQDGCCPSCICCITCHSRVSRRQPIGAWSQLRLPYPPLSCMPSLTCEYASVEAAGCYKTRKQRHSRTSGKDRYVDGPAPESELATPPSSHPLNARTCCIPGTNLTCGHTQSQRKQPRESIRVPLHCAGKSRMPIAGAPASHRRGGCYTEVCGAFRGM